MLLENSWCYYEGKCEFECEFESLARVDGILFLDSGWVVVVRKWDRLTGKYYNRDVLAKVLYIYSNVYTRAIFYRKFV